MYPKILRLVAVAIIAISLILITTLSIGLNPFSYKAPTVYAAGTINVDTTADEYDTVANGTCSLREAIQAISNTTSFGGCTNPGAADTIQLVTGTYLLNIGPASSFNNSSGSLYVIKGMTILGAGAKQTIISNTVSNSRVFNVNISTPAMFALQGLTVQGGNISGNGGGIRTYVSSNPYSFTLDDVIVKNNQSSGSGGGVYIYVATANLTNVTLENNQATVNGGGLAVDYGSQTNLNQVTVYSNTAAFGGGIYYRSQYAEYRLAMTNSTIYSNVAQTSGGGLYLDYYSTALGATANNVTVAYNRATNSSGGNIYNKQSAITLTNTIVAGGMDNTGNNNCAGDPTANISSGGYNLDSSNSCGLSSTGDLTNTNPTLASTLADNGGKTKTLALLADSPASKAGNPATPGSGGNACASIDQRDITRPQGGRCDIGAYELTPDPGLTIYLPLILKP